MISGLKIKIKECVEKYVLETYLTILPFHLSEKLKVAPRWETEGRTKDICFNFGVENSGS